MPRNDHPLDDAPLASGALVKLMVEITHAMQNLNRDVTLLRDKMDHGDPPASLRFALLSMTLFAAELSSLLARMQIVTADDE